MKACSSPKWRHRDRDSQEPGKRRRKRWHQVSPSSQPAGSQSANPDTLSGRAGSKGGDLDLGEPPQLKVEVASFLQRSSKPPEDKDEELLPEPSIYKSAKWVWWRAEKCEIPNWWAELSTVPEENTGRLAWEVRASFQLPRHMHELDPREAPFHAPPAPPSLHQQRFMPPIISAFVCWDIWEIPREKTVMYTLTLQCIMEENYPPKMDQPCLLVESIVELRREVGFYLSFTDEEVFQGIDLPQEERSSPSVPTTPTADAPGATDTPKMPPISKAAPKYARWDMVVHPSQPVVATGETPQLTATLRVKRRALQLTRTISISPSSNPPKAPLPPKSPPPARTLASVRLLTPLHGFTGVVACLKTPELVEVDQETPVGTMSIGMVPKPGLLSVSSSRVVKDNTMGLGYLDTMMTSIGRMVLGSMEPSEGPTIEDIMDQS